MMHRTVWIALALPSVMLAQTDRSQTDWANLARYRSENAAVGLPAPGENRVVFMGNSITEGWAKFFPVMFPGKPYLGRGIGGQTTPQMLVRFRQDVIALKPSVVVILAGTNDIAGNTGPSTLEMIQDNLASMAELARANGIEVVLSSVLPVYDYRWRPGLEPAPKIVALNKWMKEYAGAHGAVYLDYHTAMADARQGLRADLGDDGVHPNEAGYRIMAPLAERAIAEALGRKEKRPESELDKSLQRLVADYIDLYKRDSLSRWRELFLPSFTSTSIAADSSVSVRTLDQFYAAQERAFGTAKNMGERLEKVRIERRGRMATIWADFVYWNDDAGRRGRLVLTAVYQRTGWRFNSLVFSYYD